jgi:hypothetical protein
MNVDPPIRCGCTAEFEELCALSTTGELSLEETTFLERHLASCAKCRAVAADYHAVSRTGMARIAADTSGNQKVDSERNGNEETLADWNAAEAKQQLFEKLRAGKTVARTRPFVPTETRPVSVRRFLVPALAAAALLVVGLGAGYRLALYRMKGPALTPVAESQSPSAEDRLRTAESERDAVNARLAVNAKTMEELVERTRRRERELAELKSAKASLESTAAQASASSKEQAESFASQKDALARKLAESEQSLKSVRDQLSAVEEERRRGQLLTASLETRIDDLSAELKARDETIERDEGFLASDRDVRELMGARQLYIADVFDVDQSGSKRKPYGRVFYTKGKTLIFYAFDLDQSPGYRDAKALASKSFQVWGSAGQDNAAPVGLGVFYMDSEANRRWVFKLDDPNVLAQVNAVFVTVETKNGSKKPSGKPFLNAYLRTAPTNHP